MPLNVIPSARHAPQPHTIPGVSYLDDAERERNISTRLIRIRRLAHLEEGSFVRYLIESEGITEFLKFYDGAPIEEVYAADLHSLERAWKRLIRSLNSEAIPRNNVN